MNINAFDFNLPKQLIAQSSLEQADKSRLLYISNKSFFYFVHSYYAQATKLSDELSTTDYGINFTSSVIKDNIFACQYHPEKSSSNGLQLLSNFITYSEGI